MPGGLDFDALYPESGPISPRIASYIHFQLESLVSLWHDLAYDPKDQHGWFLQRLPPSARRRAEADEVWLQRWVQCFEDLADRIAAGRGGPDLCVCTGEEMALHVALDELRLRADWDDEMHEALHGDPIGAIERADEVMLEDNDVLLLFNPNLADLEDFSSLLPDAANLAPDQWFLPWRD